MGSWRAEDHPQIGRLVVGLEIAAEGQDLTPSHGLDGETAGYGRFCLPKVALSHHRWSHQCWPPNGPGRVLGIDSDAREGGGADEGNCCTTEASGEEGGHG